MSVVDWLLDSDPSIRRQVMRDLIGAPDAAVARERSREAAEGWGARMDEAIELVAAKHDGARPPEPLRVARILQRDRTAIGEDQMQMRVKRPAVTLVLVLGLGGLAATATESISWAVIKTPNPGIVSDAFNAVVMVGGGEGWAVGHTYNSQLAAYRTLAEHRSGPAWTVAYTPNVGDGYNELNGVAASSPSDVWAVGYWRPAGSPYNGSRTLILHWDGASWSVVPSPNPSAYENVLYGVTVIAPFDAWAAGWYYDDQLNARPLLAHWDGTTWTLVDGGTPPDAFTIVRAVTAIGPADVWAGGYTYVRGINSYYATFLEHWDGRAWTVVASPSVSTQGNRILGLSGAASNDVWAVGDTQDRGSIIAHWNGLEWQITAHSTGGTGSSALWSVTAPAANDAWAVGYRKAAYGGPDPLVQHWDGASWTPLWVPTSGIDPSFAAVTTTPAASIFIAGATNRGARTLVVKGTR